MSSKAEKYYQVPASEPGSWTRVRLGDICEVVRGVTYKKDQASEQPAKGKVPILRATNIQDSALVLDSDLVYVPSDVVSEGQMLQVGDIVVATSSGSKHLVGKTVRRLRNRGPGHSGLSVQFFVPRQILTIAISDTSSAHVSIRTIFPLKPLA